MTMTLNRREYSGYRQAYRFTDAQIVGMIKEQGAELRSVERKLPN